MSRLCVVTSNKDRYNFLSKTLSSFGIESEQKNIDLVEIQANSVEQVAIAKALSAAKQLNKPIVCEDTEFNLLAFNNFPGPYMKFVQERISLEKFLVLMQGEKNRKAIFRSVLVYAEPNGFYKTFVTELEGNILKEKRGGNGYGWDAVFELNKTKKTLAEYDYSEKCNLWNKGYLELGKWFSTKKI